MRISNLLGKPNVWKAGVSALAIAGASLGGVAAGAATVTVPGAPTITSATAGDHSISVAFTAPSSDGGSHITDYKATCLSGDGGRTRTDSRSRSPIRVNALTAGKTYSCTVAARNRLGYGQSSAPSGTVLVLPVPPGAPSITSVTAGNHSVRVSFTKPTSTGGSRIVIYKATCTSSNGGRTRSESQLRSSIRVDGLTPGKTYTCTVTARNRAGSGPASGASGPVVVLPIPVVPPGAPTITSATAGSKSVTVAFSPPVSNGGSNITDYKATCVSSDGGVSRWDDRHSSPIVVRSLTGGKTYTCTVMARNRVGFGPPSAPSSAVVALS